MSLGNKELMDQCKLYERVLKLEDEADSNDDSSIVKMRLEIPYQKFSQRKLTNLRLNLPLNINEIILMRMIRINNSYQ